MIKFLIKWWHKDPPFHKIIEIKNYENWTNIVQWIHTNYPLQFKFNLFSRTIIRPIQIDWIKYDSDLLYPRTLMQLTFTDKGAYIIYQLIWENY